MRWPFKTQPEIATAVVVDQEPATEDRQAAYTDAFINALVAQAAGTNQPVTATMSGALESAASLIARAFAVCEVDGPAMITRGLTPELMATMGRALIRRGDDLYKIDTTDGLRFLPCQTHSVDGMPDPRTWTYYATMPGPSQTLSETLHAGECLHLRYAVSPERPWRGVSPLGWATETGRLGGHILAALADESAAPRGTAVSTPKDGDDPTLEPMKASWRNARGATLWVQSQVNDWDGGGQGSTRDYQPQRFGANMPPSMVQLLIEARRETLAACGVHSALVDVGDAAALREAYRIFMHGTLAGLGRIVETELRDKLHPSITLNWGELRAADLQGKSRAVQSLTNAKVPLPDAMRIAGFPPVQPVAELMTPAD